MSDDKDIQQLQNRRYYLARRCRAWDEQSAEQLRSWLIELSDIAEYSGLTLRDYIKPADIPTKPLPSRTDLRRVWACDAAGIVVQEDKSGRLKLVAKASLPILGALHKPQKPRGDAMKKDYGTSVTIRIGTELQEKLEDYCWTNRIKRSDFIRMAIEKALLEAASEADDERA